MSFRIVAEYNTPDDTRTNLGYLTAYTWIEVTDIFGKTRMRKVSLGRDYNVPLDTARVLMEKARAAQPELHINAQFFQSL